MDETQASASQVVSRAPVAHGIDSLWPANEDIATSTAKLNIPDPSGAGPQTLIEKNALSVEALQKALESIEDGEGAQDSGVRSTSEMPRRATMSMSAITNPPTVEERALSRPRQKIAVEPKLSVEPSPTMPGRPSWHLPAAFFGGVAIAAGLAGALWVSAADTEAGSEPEEIRVNPGAITIPGGPFLQGLSNDYRLIFADICPKIAEDPKTECKEEIALAGEYPMKEMKLPAFAIDAWEVSNKDWDTCVRDGSCKPVDWDECANWSIRGLVPFLEIPQEFRSDDRPVVCINRDEAETYCKHAGGRLPSHQEWEKAARGADAFLFPWGTNWASESSNWGERDMTRMIVAGQLDGFSATSPVWSFEEGKSPYGVMNMAGNAAEWVSAGDDTLGATARGGSWRSHPLEVRTTARFPLKKANRRTDVGFRCAYDQ